MEEILASIRRILNDDETSAATDEATDKPSAEDDVLVLEESMIVAPQDTARPAFGAQEEAKPEPFSPVIAEPVAVPPRAEPAPEIEARASAMQPRDPFDDSDLVAPEAAAAAAMSVGSLMRSLAAGRATQVYSGGPTLEDIVRAELRPLLKDWLDVNLPPVVERLVRAEIERVVSRAVP
jgi:cell pole-organizing protein PopZ